MAFIHNLTPVHLASGALRRSRSEPDRIGAQTNPGAADEADDRQRLRKAYG